MAKGKVSTVLAPEDIGVIVGAIATMRERLPFLVALTPGESRQLFKLGPKSVEFVTRIVQLAQQHPELVPPAADVPELVKDVDLVQAMDQFQADLTLLASAVEDTRMQAGSEALRACLVLYGVFQSAQVTVPGLDALVRDIGVRFRRGGTRQPPAPATEG